MPFHGIARVVTQFPRLTIAVLFAAIAVAGLGLTRLVYSGTGDTGFPTHSPLTAQVQAIKQIFPGDNTAVFVVSGDNLQSRVTTSCRVVQFLEARAEVVPNSIVSATSGATKFITEQDGDIVVGDMAANCDASAPASVEAFQERLAGSGPQRPFLAGRDGQLFVYADLKVVNGAYGPFLGDVTDELGRLAEPGVSIALSGQPVFLAALQTYSERIGLYFPIIILVIALLHLEALRSVQAVFIPLLTGFLATILAFGVAGWVGVAIDEYSSTAPILVLAVAAGHSVQLLKRYMEELAKLATTERPSRADNLTALQRTIVAMGPVLTVASVAASLCLFALMTLDVPAIGQFGFIAGFGICCALLIELTFIPALRALLPVPRVKSRFGKLASHWEAVLQRFASVSLGEKRLIVGTVVIALVVILAAGALQVVPSHSAVTIFSESTPERRGLAAVEKADVGLYPLDVVFDSGSPEGAFDPSLLANVRDLSSLVRQDRDVKSIASPEDLITFLKCKFLGLATCTDVNVENREEAVQLWTILNNGGTQSPMIDESGRHIRVRLLLGTDETNRIEAIASQINRFAADRQLRVMLGGAAMTPKALADGIVGVSLTKVVLILGIVGVTGLIVFRSFLAAALFLIPSAITALSAYAFLGWTQTPLNVATASISALAVGVGVDYLVYMTFRMREELRLNPDWDSAIRNATLSAGGASLCVATAVAGGYLVLQASRDFLVHQWLGSIIPLSMVSSLVGALVLYPFAVRLLKPAFLLPKVTPAGRG